MTHARAALLQSGSAHAAVVAEIDSALAAVSSEAGGERELHLSKSRFETTLSSIGDAVIATTADGRINFMNPIAETLTGWSLKEAAGKPLKEIFHIINETSRAEVESPVDKVIKFGSVVGLANHTLLIRKDKSEIAIDDSAAPIRDETGELAGVVLVFRDVTLKRQDEVRREFLLQASALLASNIDFAQTLSAVAQLAVPTLADWCGVELGNADGSSQQVAVAHVDPAKVALAHEMRRRFPPDPNASAGVPAVLRTGKPELVSHVPPGLFEKLVKDPEQLRIARELGLNSWMVVPLRAHGKILGAITFVGAHSSRRYAETDLAFAQELANCAALAVSNAQLFKAENAAKVAAIEARESEQRLIGIVSHDLRNPLGAIAVTAAGLIQREGHDERTTRALTRILGSSERAVRMIRDLLDLTQARLGGGLPIERQRCDFHALAQQVIDEVQLIHPDAPKVISAFTGDGYGEWDPDRLMQALGNLISNAMAYGEEGTVRVSSTGHPHEVVVEIQNQGTPITEDRLATLFQPFERGADQAAGSGSIGLGLYIVKQIVHAHRGSVTVRSTEKEGTAFTLRLPRAATPLNS